MGDTSGMNTNSKEKRNNYIYILKALAIFSVICAHSTPLIDGSNKWNVLSSQLLDYLGTFGVPIFSVFPVICLVETGEIGVIFGNVR